LKNKKNRFAKRFMENEFSKGGSEKPLIALHKFLVTVRQIFSAKPAGKDRAILPDFGGTPFPLPWLHGRVGNVLMSTAPLSMYNCGDYILTL